ncbi:MAG: type II secretion system F family protein, partial [Rikenellaceae bacterium]|nr:type II secretion system F family protein [Rikenellaceae bacterium]
MPSYQYTAKNEKGKTVRGTAAAPSPEALYAQLRTEGLYLIGQREAGAGKSSIRPLKTAQVADFCRSLGTLLTAGVPLVRAFAILGEEEGLDPKAKAVYEAVRTELRKGVPLSDAME